jgi:hypothetical protein
MFAGGAHCSRQVGPAMQEMAARIGAAFLDAGAHAAVSSVDGIHFEPEAHAALGRAIGAALAGLLD